MSEPTLEQVNSARRTLLIRLANINRVRKELKRRQLIRTTGLAFIVVFVASFVVAIGMLCVLMIVFALEVLLEQVFPIYTTLVAVALISCVFIFVGFGGALCFGGFNDEKLEEGEG